MCVTHSAYDPFLHVALPKRVDPFLYWLTSLTCGRLASMPNVSVCAEAHVFLPRRDFQCIIFPIVAYQRSFGVFKSGGKYQYC